MHEFSLNICGRIKNDFKFNENVLIEFKIVFNSATNLQFLKSFKNNFKFNENNFFYAHLHFRLRGEKKKEN